MVASAVERVVVHANIQLLLTVGVLGAFTTFSTYMLESLLLIQGRSFGLFVGYVGLSNAAGLMLAAAGYNIGKQIAG